VSNNCLVKPETISLQAFSTIGYPTNHFLGFVVEGSRDGTTWEIIGREQRLNYQIVAGITTYPLQSLRDYRFLKITGLGNSTNSGEGMLAGFYFKELEFTGKIKFLK
jgi:hypothetical protein